MANIQLNWSLCEMNGQAKAWLLALRRRIGRNWWRKPNEGWKMCKFTRVLVLESASCQKSKMKRLYLLFEDCLYNDRYFGCMGTVIYKNKMLSKYHACLCRLRWTDHAGAWDLQNSMHKRKSKYETESLTDSQAQEGFPTHQESIRLNNYSVETCIKELKFLEN